MKNGELIDMNNTMRDVWRYLTERVEEDGSFIPYNEIRDAVGKKSRHAISYAVERLRKHGKISIYDRKIYILEEYRDVT